MASPPTHVILRVVLEFDFARTHDTAALQESLSRSFWRCLTPVADRLLTAANSGQPSLYLDRIEVDVGFLSEEHLEEQITERFAIAFEQALDQALTTQATKPLRPLGAVPDDDRRCELLAHFLEHGFVPWWWTESLPQGFEPLLKGLAAESPENLRAVLVGVGWQETVRRRLVLQLSDTGLQAVVAVLEPGEADFIVGYANSLQQDHDHDRIVPATSKDFRNATWGLILEDLLVDPGSEFNRSQFIARTIAGMAQRFGMRYEDLLRHLAEATPTGCAPRQMPSTVRIINELWDEAQRALPETRTRLPAAQGSLASSSSIEESFPFLLDLLSQEGSRQASQDLTPEPASHLGQDIGAVPQGSLREFWTQVVSRVGARTLARRLARTLPESSLTHLLRALGGHSLVHAAQNLAASPPFARPLPGRNTTAPSAWVWEAAFEALPRHPRPALQSADRWLAGVINRLGTRLRAAGLAPDFTRVLQQAGLRTLPSVLLRQHLAALDSRTRPALVSARNGLDRELAALACFATQGRRAPLTESLRSGAEWEGLLLHLLRRYRRPTAAWIRRMGARRGGWEVIVRRFSDRALEGVVGALRSDAAAAVISGTRSLLRDPGLLRLPRSETIRLRHLTWQAALRAVTQPVGGSPSELRLTPAAGWATRRLGDSPMPTALLEHLQVLTQEPGRTVSLPSRELLESWIARASTSATLPCPGVPAWGTEQPADLPLSRSTRRHPSPELTVNRPVTLASLRTDPTQALALLDHFLVRGRVFPPTAFATLSGGPDALLLRLLLRHRRRTLAFIRKSRTRRDVWVNWARRFQDDTLAALIHALAPEIATTLVPLARFLLLNQVGSSLLGGGRSHRRLIVWRAALRLAGQRLPAARSSAAILAAYLTDLKWRAPHKIGVMVTRVAEMARSESGSTGVEVLRLLAPLVPPQQTPDREPQPGIPSDRAISGSGRLTPPRRAGSARDEIPPFARTALASHPPDGRSLRPQDDAQLQALLGRDPRAVVTLLRWLRRHPTESARVMNTATEKTLKMLVMARLPRSGHLLASGAAVLLGVPTPSGFQGNFRRKLWQALFDILLLPAATSWSQERLLRAHFARLANGQGVLLVSLRSTARQIALARPGAEWRQLEAALSRSSMPSPSEAEAHLRHRPRSPRRRDPGDTLRHDQTTRLRLFQEFLQQPRRTDPSRLKRFWEFAHSDSTLLYRELIQETALRPETVRLAELTGGFDLLSGFLIGDSASERARFSEWIRWIEQAQTADTWLGFPSTELRWRILMAVQALVRRGHVRAGDMHILVIDGLLRLGVWRRLIPQLALLRPPLSLTVISAGSLREASPRIGLARFLCTVLSCSLPPVPDTALDSLRDLAAGGDAEHAGSSVTPEVQRLVATPSRIPRLPPEKPAEAATPWLRRSRPSEVHGGPIFVANAGLVLVASFFPTYFKICGLLREGKFTNPAAAERAVHLLQYLLTFDDLAFEHSLALNKVLCGLDIALPIATGVTLHSEERQAGKDLLANAIRHWGRVTLSIDGFRNSFLCRPGKLERTEDAWKLAVERRAYDALLTSIPWGFSVIKTAYMPLPVFVDWI